MYSSKSCTCGFDGVVSEHVQNAIWLPSTPSNTYPSTPGVAWLLTAIRLIARFMNSGNSFMISERSFLSESDSALPRRHSSRGTGDDLVASLVWLLSPLRGWLTSRHAYLQLALWAAVFRRFAALVRILHRYGSRIFFLALG